MLTTRISVPLLKSLTDSDTGSPNIREGYIPGTCNIGKKEIERRKKATIFSFVICIFYIAVMEWYEADKIWKLFLLIPAASFGVSFQQWYFKFCVAFGIKGVFNFGNVGKTFSLDQQEDFRKDRMKAWQMIMSGMALGLAAGGVYYLLSS